MRIQERGDGTSRHFGNTLVDAKSARPQLCSVTGDWRGRTSQGCKCLCLQHIQRHSTSRVIKRDVEDLHDTNARGPADAGYDCGVRARIQCD